MTKMLIALFSGITVGILFAPAKGSETRKYLKDAVDDLKDSFLSDVKEINAELKDLGKTIDSKTAPVPARNIV